MTDYSALLKADNDQPARSIHLVEAAGYDDWLAAQPDRVRAIVAAQKFQGKPGELAIVPGEAAGDWWVVAGIANKAAPGPWCLAKLAETLPEGMYRL
ncbi:MAG: leucyl aminopeptidase family protein, partial [Alphaproteobacteria bacterium]|nr:leucyl aminopeptidase family protein [Alphaproteobacteria bacterium]